MTKVDNDVNRSESAPALKGRIKYKLLRIAKEPTTAVGILTALLFTYLIVLPIISLLSDAFRVQYGDEHRAGQPVGSFTPYYILRIFASDAASKTLWKPLLNTLTISFGAIIIALIVGGSMAWFLSRTNIWGRKWLATALIVPYMLPAWTFALAWTTVFKNRKMGGTYGWLESIGINPPDWLSYGALPIIVTLALHYSPFVILLFGNALKRFDSQLEDSARILGADRKTVNRKIILPLMKPSLVSASILIFAKGLGEFGVAYVLGVPGNYHVLATSLYANIQSRNTGAGAVLAGVIVIIGALALLVDARMLREGKRFVTVGSKGSMSRLRDLGKMRIPAFGAALTVFAVGAVLPMSVLFLSTVMRKPADFSLSNFTSEFWIGTNLDTIALETGVLVTPAFWEAAWNTLWIVGLAAIVAGILGLLVGYVVVRTPVKFLSQYVRQVAFFPYLVPGIAFAAAMLSLFAVQRGPIPALYGTGLLLLLAYIADQMPYASRAGISAMMQLGNDPEEAAKVLGAGWWRRMASIVVPIQKSALSTGVLLPFISGIKGLSLVVLLATPGTDVLATYSLNLVDYGYDQAANAVVLMIAILALTGTLLGQKLTKSNLAEGLGG
ncbi:MAG TPA: iron ABC transporter permease [Beutenbergiaceae bacterium]|nr:iron ABC transporter permease [Beutenbergiaceae bacterium]